MFNKLVFRTKEQIDTILHILVNMVTHLLVRNVEAPTKTKTLQAAKELFTALFFRAEADGTYCINVRTEAHIHNNVVWAMLSAHRKEQAKVLRKYSKLPLWEQVVVLLSEEVLVKKSAVFHTVTQALAEAVADRLNMSATTAEKAEWLIMACTAAIKAVNVITEKKLFKKVSVKALAPSVIKLYCNKGIAVEDTIMKLAGLERILPEVPASIEQLVLREEAVRLFGADLVLEVGMAGLTDEELVLLRESLIEGSSSKQCEDTVLTPPEGVQQYKGLRALYAGIEVGCCQHPAGAGRAAAYHAAYAANGAVWALTGKKGNIQIQSWVWLDEESNTLVLDSIEFNILASSNKELAMQRLKEFVEAVRNVRNEYSSILIGIDYMPTMFVKLLEEAGCTPLTEKEYSILNNIIKENKIEYTDTNKCVRL